jgi:S-(hydroxymethyl)mycothiol dehydrogenase
VTIEDLTLGAPEPGEVVVRIQASGVCHSDLHFARGAIGDEHPLLVGHEGAGVVVAVGDGVTNVDVGDYVALTYRAPCHRCRFCRRSQPSRCADPRYASSRLATSDGQALTPILGLGTSVSHTVVAAEQAIPVPSSIPPEQACLFGCGVITGIGAVLHTAAVEPGATVAVIGCGGVGSNAVQGARLARASTIVAIDVDAGKLASAAALGATDTVDAGGVDAVAAVRELTDGNGVDYVFDVVGAPATLAQAMAMLDAKGTVVLVGVPPPTSNLEIDLQRFFLSGGTLKACLGGDSTPAHDFALLAQWVRQGELNLADLITRTIPIDDIEPAFAAMEAGEVLRSVIMFP